MIRPSSFWSERIKSAAARPMVSGDAGFFPDSAAHYSIETASVRNNGNADFFMAVKLNPRSAKIVIVLR